MATLFTDDFSQAYTYWNTDNWTTTVTGTSATIDIFGGEGRTTVPNGASRYLLAVGKETARTEEEVLVKVKKDVAGRNSLIIIGVAMSGIAGGKPSNPTDGVWLRIPNNTTAVTLEQKRGGTNLASQAVTPTMAAASYSWVRLRVTSTTVYVKIWADGGAEPGTWSNTYDITGAAALPAGNVVLGHETTSSTSAAGSVYWDDVTVSDVTSSSAVNFNASAATASALMKSPAMKFATDFDNMVDPFTKVTGGTDITHSVASGNLVVTRNAGSTEMRLDLNGFDFVDGGQILFRATNTGTGVQVLGHVGGYPTGSTYGSPATWIRVERVSSGTYRYRTWADGSLEGTTWTTGSPAGVTFDSTMGLLFRGGSAGNTVTVDKFYANTAGPVNITAPVSFSAAVATGTGQMADPSLALTGNKSVSPLPATGSATAPDAAVSVESHIDVVVNALPLQGDGAMAAGSGFALNLEVEAGAATGSGLALDASVSTELNAKVVATRATGSGLLLSPDEARNAENDPYYAMVKATTDWDDFWFRLDETTGAVAAASAGGTGEPKPEFNAALYGAYSWNVIGPEGRKGIHFDGGYLDMPVVTDGGMSSAGGDSLGITRNFAYEFTIRTNQKNGLISWGLDTTSALGNVGVNMLSVNNGRIAFTSAGIGRTGAYTENPPIVGFRDIADGEWHHVVVTFSPAEGNYLTGAVENTGFRVYIDGQLEFRRAISGDAVWPIADFMFGGPTGYSPLIDKTPAFVGDVMEVIVRQENALTGTQSQRLFYSAMGITPIMVEPATGAGVMPQASKAKGNRPRALVLGMFNSFNMDTYNADRGDFAFEPFLSGEGEFAGMLCFNVHIFAGPNGVRRDPVTDEPRMLNLQMDLNLDDYDVIMFNDWPDTGREMDMLASTGIYQKQIDDFIMSVRQAVVDGKGLWVTNPVLATRLGLITNAERISMMRETYDTWAAKNDPWKNVGGINSGFGPTEPDSSGRALLYTADTHDNNRLRIVDTVPGLTDFPATTMTDVIHSRSFYGGQDNRISNFFAFKYAEKPNGLGVGDEFVDVTKWLVEPEVYPGWGRYGLSSQNVKTTYGVPPGSLIGGRSIAKFGANVIMGEVSEPNPYANYTAVAVWAPGDRLVGTAIKGRIFMNLTEDNRNGDFVYIAEKQLVNNEQLPEGSKETAAMLAYQWSTRRFLYISGYQSGIGGAIIIDENGNISVAPSGTGSRLKLQYDRGGKPYMGTSRFESLPTLEITEQWPTVPFDNPVWTMNQRGLAWLSTRDEEVAGSKRVVPEPATAAGSMPQPAVTAQKHMVIEVGAAQARGVLVSPDEVPESDVEVYAYAATATGRMRHPSKAIHVEPMTGSGEMPWNAEMVDGMADEVTLYIYNVEATLYLQEVN